MAFVEVGTDFDAVEEKKVVPAGKYRLTIASAENTESNGKPNVNTKITIDGHPEAKSIYHALWLPMSSDDSEKAQNKILFIRRFLDAFKIPYSGAKFDPDTFPGKSTEMELKVEEYPAGSGEFKNTLKLPPLKKK